MINEEIRERIYGILNRLEWEDVETLSKEIGQIDTHEISNVVASSVFEKAVAEPRLCAQFCRFVGKQFSKFKSTLISKCQSEYLLILMGKEGENGEKLKPLWSKFVKANNPKTREECRANYLNEERKLKERSIGIVRFIGELFLVGFLTPNIMLSCIDSLLDRVSDDNLEFMCILLTIVGKLLEAKEKKMEMQYCFIRMKKIVNQDSPKIEISSSVRFMIRDVIDLRNRNWKMIEE